jgi:hypothetical protein
MNVFQGVGTVLASSRSPRLPSRLSWLSLAVIALAVCPRPAEAQLEFGPRLGAYVPVGAIVDQPGATFGAKGLQKHQVGSVFAGIRATAWATGRFALEANVALSPSYVAVTDSTGIHDHVAHVLLANARGIFGLTRENLLYVGAGPGMVARSGAVWNGNRELTAPALVLSAGARTPIRSRMSIRLEVEDYISRPQLDQTIATNNRVAHHDFLWSVGVMIPLTGGGGGSREGLAKR